MKPSTFLASATALLAYGTIACAADGASAAPLSLAVTTEFPGYTGDFDHFAIDGHREHLVPGAAVRDAAQ